jgi:hypothetical protein
VECPCVIKANFGQEPFKFDVRSIPLVPKTPPINHFESLPQETILRILDVILIQFDEILILK